MNEIIELQKKRDDVILEGINIKQEIEFARVTSHTHTQHTYI